MKREDAGRILFLSRNDVESVLTYKEVLDVCDKTFKWIDQGKVKQVPCSPIILDLADPTGHFMLPHHAYIEPLGVAGNKWGGGCRANRQRGLPFVSMELTLNDAETGIPIAIMDGNSITSMRTGGHAGVGANYLARKDSDVIAIIGCGVEGRSHLGIMNELFKIREVRITDHKRDNMDKYKKEMSQALDVNMKQFDTPEEAVKGADVICVTSTANMPLVLDEWIEPGVHVCATQFFMDVDPRFSKTADKWVVGNYERDLQWVTAAGLPEEFAALVRAAISKEDIYAELSEIANGKKLGRTSDKERTAMTHLGMGALDVATAYLAYKAAGKKGLGTELRLF